MTSSCSFYRRRPSLLRLRAAPVMLSLLLAGCTFALLPFFGFLSSISGGRVDLRPAPAIVTGPEPPPPPRQRVREVEKKRPAPKLEPKPKLEAKRQRIEALQTKLSLGAVSLETLPGDVALEFDVREEDLVGFEKEDIPVFDAAELDRAPSPVLRVSPIYPLRARQHGVEGFVELLFVVDVDGSTRYARVLDADPPGMFDRAALAAVRKWRFKPGKKDGRPVAARVRLVVRFELEE